MRSAKLLLAAVTLLAVSTLAEGVIKALLPLDRIVKESQYIVVAKVDQVFAEKPAMILQVADDLKGKAPFRRLPVHLKGDKEAEKEKHVPQLLKRLAPELPVVLFVNYDAGAKQYISFAYTNGTWFQLIGKKSDDSVVWSLAHGEPYLRRTFKGTTDEMKQALTASLAGKKKLPPVDAKEAPGFGPEVAAK